MNSKGNTGMVLVLGSQQCIEDEVFFFLTVKRFRKILDSERSTGRIKGRKSIKKRISGIYLH